MTEQNELPDGTTVADHDDEYHCVLPDSTTMEVPKDPRNKHYKLIQAWIAKGNTPTNGDAGPRRRMRQSLQEDPFRRALTKYLAKQKGITVAALRQAILDEL